MDAKIGDIDNEMADLLPRLHANRSPNALEQAAGIKRHTGGIHLIWRNHLQHSRDCLSAWQYVQVNNRPYCKEPASLEVSFAASGHCAVQAGCNLR